MAAGVRREQRCRRQAGSVVVMMPVANANTDVGQTHLLGLHTVTQSIYNSWG